MMMPHETQEMLTLLREINETLKAMLANADKPGGGPAVQPIEEDDSKSKRK